MPNQGLYANIHAKKKRIASGSGEKMRIGKTLSAQDFKDSEKTAKKKKSMMNKTA